MDQFERYYDTVILSQYGNPIAQNLSNDLPHYLSIPSRLDMTRYPVYVIDSIGCTDADDGFSIYYLNDNLYLAVYIADPTEYINPKSELWKVITERVITRYPTNRAPNDMMPDSIVKRATLSTDNEELKNVIAIITQIDKDTHLPIGPTQLEFAMIRVTKELQFAYYQARIDVFVKLGLKISTALQHQRKACGALIVEDPVTTINSEDYLQNAKINNRQ